jgi:hemolysin activation/secretion protein
LLLTQKSQINLTSGFDYTDRQDDYALQARLLGKTYSLDSVNQHARYPALEVGINGAHQFTTASISGRLNVRQGIDAMGADIVSAPRPDINFTLTKSYLDAACCLPTNGGYQRPGRGLVKQHVARARTR